MSEFVGRSFLVKPHVVYRDVYGRVIHLAGPWGDGLVGWWPQDSIGAAIDWTSHQVRVHRRLPGAMAREIYSMEAAELTREGAAYYKRTMGGRVSRIGYGGWGDSPSRWWEGDVVELPQLTSDQQSHILEVPF